MIPIRITHRSKAKGTLDFNPFVAAFEEALGFVPSALSNDSEGYVCIELPANLAGEQLHIVHALILAHTE